MIAPGPSCPSGLYRIDESQRRQLLDGQPAASRLHIATIDCAVAFDRMHFFARLAQTLHFPEYFGLNWDAVYDCLTDLSWPPETTLVILLDHFDVFAALVPDQVPTAVKVFQDAGAFWHSLNRLFFILMHDPQMIVPHVSPLPARCLSSDPSDQGSS